MVYIHLYNPQLLCLSEYVMILSSNRFSFFKYYRMRNRQTCLYETIKGLILNIQILCSYLHINPINDYINIMDLYCVNLKFIF